MRSSQRLCNLVSECLHYISHTYHAISDLMVDMGREPPRLLRAMPPQPTAIIPVQVSGICKQSVMIKVTPLLMGLSETLGMFIKSYDTSFFPQAQINVAQVHSGSPRMARRATNVSTATTNTSATAAGPRPSATQV